MQPNKPSGAGDTFVEAPRHDDNALEVLLARFLRVMAHGIIETSEDEFERFASELERACAWRSACVFTVQQLAQLASVISACERRFPDDIECLQLPLGQKYFLDLEEADLAVVERTRERANQIARHLCNGRQIVQLATDLENRTRRRFDAAGAFLEFVEKEDWYSRVLEIAIHTDMTLTNDADAKMVAFLVHKDNAYAKLARHRRLLEAEAGFDYSREVAFRALRLAERLREYLGL